MAKLIYIIPFVLFGCASKPVYITTECPSPPPIARPELTFPKLPDDALPGDAFEACYTDITNLINYAEKQEAILNGYKK